MSLTARPRVPQGCREHQGKEELRQAVGGIWAAEGRTNVHLCLNVLVDETADARAVARSTLVIVAATPPFAILGVSAIAQDLMKTEGEWKVESRTVSNLTLGST
jgi:hypothetical protein